MPQLRQPSRRVHGVHQGPRADGWKRSAAKTPIWHHTELSTRLIVFARENAMFSFAGWVTNSSGTTERIVKYIANRPAKNINSLDSHTMVPTWTMFGRFTAGCAGGLPTADAVATPTLFPPLGIRAAGGTSFGVASASPRVASPGTRVGRCVFTRAACHHWSVPWPGPSGRAAG